MRISKDPIQRLFSRETEVIVWRRGRWESEKPIFSKMRDLKCGQNRGKLEARACNGYRNQASYKDEGQLIRNRSVSRSDRVANHASLASFDMEMIR